jgi:ABC-2 type transport system ATP-binding protein
MIGTKAALSLKRVEKKLDRMTLGPIDFEIEPGYVVAVVGPNGSGKSTLFRMLMNLVKPDNGEIRILQKSYPDEEVELKRKIGYVPEAAEWEEAGPTIRHLTEFVSRWYPDWNRERYHELMVRFGLEGKQKLKQLSKGMQRKLAFIHAIAQEPDILLLDEPTSGLDPFAWRAMMDEVMRFMEQGGKSVVMATHILDEVRRMADYVAFMYEGRLLGFYEKDTLLDQWKAIWVERPPVQAHLLPGLVRVDDDKSPAGPVRLVTNSPLETEAALRHQGIAVHSMTSLELDEIFTHLIQRRGSHGTAAN